MGTWRHLAEEGMVMTYGYNWPAMMRRAAEYADRILRGVRPSDLPIEQPTTFDFVVNRKAARALGLTLPPSILVQATEVID